MEENLTLAMREEFPSLEERKAIVWRAWRNFAQGMREIACSIYSSKEEIRSTIAIQGEEHLQSALKKGKGVIALSAHLGSFTMIGVRLAAVGYPFSVVVKQPKDQRFARLLDEYRARVGAKTISARPRREAARQILKALRRNDVVLMVADEFKSAGVEVEFLGLTALAPRGPVTLAMRAGASVVPMFVARDDQDRLTLYIWPEIDLAKTGDLQGDVASNVALFTRELETMVRSYPDQWNWLGFHRNGRRPRSEMVKSKTAGPDPRDLSF
jgi:KDO2-lipid IV(A) lauroyltransferase